MLDVLNTQHETSLVGRCCILKASKYAADAILAKCANPKQEKTNQENKVLQLVYDNAKNELIIDKII